MNQNQKNKIAAKLNKRNGVVKVKQPTVVQRLKGQSTKTKNAWGPAWRKPDEVGPPACASYGDTLAGVTQTAKLRKVVR